MCFFMILSHKYYGVVKKISSCEDSNALNMLGWNKVYCQLQTKNKDILKVAH